MKGNPTASASVQPAPPPSKDQNAKKIERRDACIYACIYAVPTPYPLGTYSALSDAAPPPPGLVYEKVGLKYDYKFSGEREYVVDGEVGRLRKF